MLYHVLVFAFLIVIASTALMTPILLYVFNLRSVGWLWQHAALFSAMIAPTDAVSVSSILKKGAPKHAKAAVCRHCCLGECMHCQVHCGLAQRSTHLAGDLLTPIHR